MKSIIFILSLAASITLFSKVAHAQQAFSTGNVELQLTNVKKPIEISYASNEVVCNDTTHVRAETKGYYVNICGTPSQPNRYVGSSKTGQAIILPLKTYSPGKYIAVSGNITYILTPDYLTVTKSGRTILKQRIISWR